ncbi:tape measure protein [Terrihalobacillus insolitus]|uniref:tape measure protein n=1 Tax=Terrihalobacillus insolitus TaxID=2950438 RepID=UPI002341E132|nr:tape measure protein [Terrihalobacillus insolitus]MDC3414264.1 tape measure protein [Terrihalobacillus insolitus]
MARRNSVEIVLSAQDEASKEIAKSVKKTTREFSSLNRSLKSVGLNSEQIDKINKEIKDVNPDILEKELQNVRVKLKELGLSSNEIEKITKEMNQVEGELEQVQKETKKASKSFKKLGSVGKAVGASIAAGFAAAGAAIATALSAGTLAIGKFGTQFNATMEQSKIAWETLLGSAEKSQKMVSDLLNMSEKTPFLFEGLDNSAKLLKAMGFEAKDLLPTMKTVGDAVAGLGGSTEQLQSISRALGQIKTKGKLSAEEINQLAEAGIGGWKILSDQIGKSEAELMKMAASGKLMADEVIPSLLKGMDENFGGAMKKQSKTFNGLLSTLGDKLKIFSGQIMKPTFDRMEEMLPGVIAEVDNMKKAFAEGGWKGVMEELLPTSVYEFIIGAFNGIKSTIGGILDWYKSIAKSAFSGEGNMGQSFVRMFNTVKSIALPILKDAVAFIKNTLDRLNVFWKENGTQIIQAVKNMWNIIAGIFETIAPVITFIVKMLWDTVKGLISGALKVIMGLIKVFSGIFTGDFSKMWEGIKQIFFGAIQAVWNYLNLMFVGRILTVLKMLGKKMLTNVKYYWYVIKEGFMKLANGARNIVSGMVRGVIQYFGNLLVQARTTFSLLRQFGENIFMALWNTVRSIASNIFYSVKGSFRSLFQSSRGIFNNLWNTAKSIFRRIKEAVISPIRTAKDTVLGLIDRIKNAFNFSWSLPKLKLPRVSVSMEKNGWGIPYPDFDVNWYDKGAVFTGPSVIGVAEKRPEFVGALDDLKNVVREVMREEKGNGTTNENVVYEFQLSIPVDGRELVKRTISFTEEELDRRKKRSTRFRG